MAQKQRKTVPHTELLPKSIDGAGSTREFLKAAPQLAFLLPSKKRSERRLRAVKRIFSRILSAIIPAMAQKDPQQLHELLQH